MIKGYKTELIDKLNESILFDEFNDTSQNEKAYENCVSGEVEAQKLANLISNISEKRVLNIGSGGDASFFNHIVNLEPNEHRVSKTHETIGGWAENIQTFEQFDIVYCWGTFCFVRGPQEALVEFNRVLKTGGHLLFDIVSASTMPLAQTVNPDSFIRFVELFGFQLQAFVDFGPQHHKRRGLLCVKSEDFNVSKLRMPQCLPDGTVANFLQSRDWFLL